MTFVHVLIKKGRITHKYMHWREVISLFANNFKDMEGKELEAVIIDLDRHRIISSQTCFNLLSLPPQSIQTVLTQFEYEESA